MINKHFFIRVSVYSFLLLCSLVLVLVKQHMITAQRERAVVSAISEWEKKGKPVDVIRLTRSDFYTYLKITAERSQGTDYSSYVSQTEWEQLSEGQEVYYAANTQEFCGTIRTVASERDLDKGLFKVTMDLGKSARVLNGREIVFVHTGTIPDVVQVPDEAVDVRDGKTFVRIVKDGSVKTVEITIGMIGREGSIVESGLTEGDLVITNGKTLTDDHDRVFIRKEVKQ